jgi:hypothetical protein
MDHLVLRHLSYRRGFTYPFSFSVVSRLEGEDIVKEGGRGPPPPARWAENTVTTKITQEKVAIASLCTLLSVVFISVNFLRD